MLDFFKTKKLQRVLFIPDVHFPYNDKRYWKLLLKVAKAVGVEIIVILGDFIDCYSISRYSKDPRRTSNFKQEIQSAKAAIKELDKLNAKRKIYLNGNHETRIWSYIQDKAPELYGCFSLRELLGVDDSWEWVEYKESTKVGKMYVTHDVGHAGMYAAQHTLNAFQDNVAFGHTHRGCVIYQGNVKGVPHVCLNAGWGGDVEKIDYMHKAKAKRDWMLGFGFGYLEKNGNIHAHFIPVINYRCVVDGELFEL